MFDRLIDTFSEDPSLRYTEEQGQKFVAVMKAKNRGTATSQNAKNRGKICKNRGTVMEKIA